MRRRPNVFPSGIVPVGYVPNPTHLRQLDRYAAEMINGDEGGSWSPANPIAIGFNETKLTTVGSVISGNVETVKGNRAVDPDGGLRLDASSWPTFDSGQQRTIVVPFLDWIEHRAATDAHHYAFLPHPTYLCPQSWNINDGSSNGMFSVPLGRAAHHNASITSVTFRWRVGRARTENPENFPSFRVIRLTTDTIYPLHDNTGAYDAEGWKPAQSSEYALAQVGFHDLVYTPNQYNESIDSEAYQFLLQVRDEYGSSGIKEGNYFLSARVQISDIVDLRPE